jgi:two-component system chemotaxis response regulator CheY
MSTATAASFSATDMHRKRSTILVVDDDESMRALLRLHLSNAGYDVLVAEDAIVAGHLVLREAPDLLIVDVQMPYMNGYEFVAALKSDADTREIPVIFLTTDDQVAEHARKLGAAAYLNKPVTADHLLQVVGLFVERAA